MEILKKSIEEIMADNYDEINEPFKLQAQHVFVANSSESDEPSANMYNYVSASKIKCFTIQEMVQSKKNKGL